jgi:hypothetical protein
MVIGLAGRFRFSPTAAAAGPARRFALCFFDPFAVDIFLRILADEFSEAAANQRQNNG